MATDSAEDAFDVMLNRIGNLIRMGNYDGCANRASDLITIAICFDHKTGLFVGSVLSDAFEQVDHTTQTRMIDAGHLRDISSQLLVHLDAVMKSYKKDDKIDLYNTLAEISGAAARFFYYGFELPKRPGVGDLLNADG